MEAPNPLPIKTGLDDTDRSVGALELDPSGRVCGCVAPGMLLGELPCAWGMGTLKQIIILMCEVLCAVCGAQR